MKVEWRCGRQSSRPLIRPTNLFLQNSTPLSFGILQQPALLERWTNYLYFALRQCGRRKSNCRCENGHQFWDMRRVLALCDFFIFVVTNTLFFSPLKRPIHVIALSDPPSIHYFADFTCVPTGKTLISYVDMWK